MSYEHISRAFLRTLKGKKIPGIPTESPRNLMEYRVPKLDMVRVGSID